MVYTVKQARMLADKSQRACAQAIGVCEQTYRKIENNPETATIKQAMDLSSFLGIPYDNISFAHNSN